MKLNKFFIIGLIVFIATGTNYAQGDSVLKFSLAEAQSYAVENFYSSKNAKLDIEKANKVIQETRAIGLPQISASGAFQYTPKLSPVVEGFSGINILPYWMYHVNTYLHSEVPNDPFFIPGEDPGFPQEPNLDDYKWSLNASVTASQLIFSGSYIVALQSTKVYKSLTNLNWAKSVQDVTESVKNAYFNVLIARENLLILDSAYKNMEKTLIEFRAIGKQGLVDQTDVDQLELTIANIKISLDYIARMTDLAEKLFKIQLGLNVDSKIELTDELNLLINNLAYENLLVADFVLEHNVDYQMLKTLVKSDELLLKLIKSNYLPTIAGFYQYYKEFNDNAFSFNPPHVIGASINIPIFTSGSNGAKVSQAKIELMKDQNKLEQFSSSIKLDFYNSKSELIAAKDKYSSNTRNLELAMKIYNNSLVKYKNGMISSIELTQAQNQYLEVQSNYYLSLQELIAATNKLEKLLTSNIQ